ncbi:MAG TPA: DUF5706 domain-containing protein [Candidatus Syntrophosphaera sp.]|nr:DUF5706 domain-containing protein [Candidatus Syntrophosphaera sp.]
METPDPITPDQLEKINTGIRDMVQFGESKNGVLMAANLAILYNVAGKAISFAGTAEAILSTAAIALFAVSSLILIYSIVPKLKFVKSGNPLFFGSITKMSRDEYVQLCAKLSKDELARYYAEQIHVNSGFAVRKFRDFKRAAFFAVPSYVLFAILYLI